MNIQQLRAQIAALQDATMDENKNFRSDYDEGRFDALSVVDALLDSLQDEPVSEDLESEIQRYYVDWDEHPQYVLTARHFAKWQKEQFEKNRLAHCDAQTEEDAEIECDFVTQHLKENNRTPTFIDAIEYGMKLQKEQMMKGAIDVKINRDTLYDLKPFIHEKYLDYKIGDKCKIILIKEG